MQVLSGFLEVSNVAGRILHRPITCLLVHNSKVEKGNARRAGTRGTYLAWEVRE